MMWEDFASRENESLMSCGQVGVWPGSADLNNCSIILPALNPMQGKTATSTHHALLLVGPEYPKPIRALESVDKYGLFFLSFPLVPSCLACFLSPFRPVQCIESRSSYLPLLFFVPPRGITIPAPFLVPTFPTTPLHPQLHSTTTST